jgi:hypothetical protein
MIVAPAWSCESAYSKPRRASFCATRLAEPKTNLQGCLSAEAFWTLADTHTSKRASEVIAR